MNNRETRRKELAARKTAKKARMLQPGAQSKYAQKIARLGRYVYQVDAQGRGIYNPRYPAPRDYPTD